MGQYVIIIIIIYYDKSYITVHMNMSLKALIIDVVVHFDIWIDQLDNSIRGFKNFYSRVDETLAYRPSSFLSLRLHNCPLQLVVSI